MRIGPSTAFALESSITSALDQATHQASAHRRNFELVRDTFFRPTLLALRSLTSYVRNAITTGPSSPEVRRAASFEAIDPRVLRGANEDRRRWPGRPAPFHSSSPPYFWTNSSFVSSSPSLRTSALRSASTRPHLSGRARSISKKASWSILAACTSFNSTTSSPGLMPHVAAQEAGLTCWTTAGSGGLLRKSKPRRRTSAPTTNSRMTCPLRFFFFTFFLNSSTHLSRNSLEAAANSLGSASKPSLPATKI
mmetsp:Transcript_83819/g.164134  ORF Transcript_83819/g.164134 Transcript_83819/m.164134 type:complete len:251 (+) Transcript_83819:128-880(+)